MDMPCYIPNRRHMRWRLRWERSSRMGLLVSWKARRRGREADKETLGSAQTSTATLATTQSLILILRIISPILGSRSRVRRRRRRA
jgi:hypothetical protein